MILGLGFALVCALGTNLSGLFKARGAVLAPPVRVRHPVRSAADLFRSRWFAAGWIALFIEALALAPLSTVQAILFGGLVFLAVLAERFFGFHLGRHQWGGFDAHRHQTGGDRPDRDLRGAATLFPCRADRVRERDPGGRRRARQDLDPPRRRTPPRSAAARDRRRRPVRGLRRRDQVPHTRTRTRVRPAQPMDAHRADLVRNLFLRFSSQPPARAKWSR